MLPPPILGQQLSPGGVVVAQSPGLMAVAPAQSPLLLAAGARWADVSERDSRRGSLPGESSPFLGPARISSAFSALGSSGGTGLLSGVSASMRPQTGTLLRGGLRPARPAQETSKTVFSSSGSYWRPAEKKEKHVAPSAQWATASSSRADTQGWRSGGARSNKGGSSSPRGRVRKKREPFVDLDTDFCLPPPARADDIASDEKDSAFGAEGAELEQPQRRRRFSSSELEDEDSQFEIDIDEHDGTDEDLVKSPSGTTWVKCTRRFSLDTEYSLWYDSGQNPRRGGRPADEKQYERALHCIGSFRTVQGFWRFWNSMEVSSVPTFASLSICKSPIKPMWEDPHNVNGGRWVFKSEKTRTKEFFTNLALALIGGYFECHESLCCIVLVAKPKFDTISIWNREVDPSLFTKVDFELRELLGIENDENLVVEYKDHQGQIHNNQVKRGLVTHAPKTKAEEQKPKQEALATKKQVATLTTTTLVQQTGIRTATTAIATAGSSSSAVASLTQSGAPEVVLAGAPEFKPGATTHSVSSAPAAQSSNLAVAAWSATEFVPGAASHSQQAWGATTTYGPVSGAMIMMPSTVALPVAMSVAGVTATNTYHYVQMPGGGYVRPSGQMWYAAGIPAGYSTTFAPGGAIPATQGVDTRTQTQIPNPGRRIGGALE